MYSQTLAKKGNIVVQLEWTQYAGWGFAVEREALGTTFDSTIGGYPVTVHLPREPEEASTEEKLRADPAYLRRPEGVHTGSPSSSNWGWISSFSPYSNPDPVPYVRQIALTAELGTADGGVDLAATDIAATVHDWWSTAALWLEIITGQPITRFGNSPSVMKGVAFDVLESGEWSRKDVAVPSSVPSSPTLRRELATGEILKRCFALAGTMTSVPVSWALVRDARSLHLARQFRRAVIDVGSAAEMAVKDLMHHQLLVTVPPGIAKRLTQRELTLGAASEVLSGTGYSLPANFWSELVAVRNRVIHLDSGKGTGDVTAAESRSAIEIAAEIVEAAYPLPTGCIRLW